MSPHGESGRKSRTRLVYWSPVIDPDTEAESVRRRAGLEDEDLPSGAALANALGVNVRKVDPRLLRGSDACLIKLHGSYEIFVARKLPPVRLHWAIAHELSEMRLKEIGYELADVEQRADAIAAALVMPRSVYRVAVREYGARVDALAPDFLVDQTAAALRLAEVREAEVAVVVTPQRVYARAPEEWCLPSEAAIRRGRLAAHPDVKTVPITDAHRRTLYVVR
jgi:hypothetical protein